MIEIIYIEENESYTIESPEQARDSFDRHLAELAIEHAEPVCMGKFIAKVLPKK